MKQCKYACLLLLAISAILACLAFIFVEPSLLDAAATTMLINAGIIIGILIYLSILWATKKIKLSHAKLAESGKYDQALQMCKHSIRSVKTSLQEGVETISEKQRQAKEKDFARKIKAKETALRKQQEWKL